MEKKKKLGRWLEYAYSVFPNPVFWFQFDEKVPPLFEKLINKRIDWKRCDLFIEPIDEKYIFHLQLAHYPKFGAQNRELVVLKCALNGVEGHICWYNGSSDKTLRIMDPIIDEKLVFSLQYFDHTNLLFRLRSVDEPIPVHTLTLINGIPVTYEVIPHEGYISFEFRQIPDEFYIEVLKKILDRARDRWNKLNKGLFHNIYFAPREIFFQDDNPNTILFYFDSGSAEVDSIEFIMNELEEEKLDFVGLKIITI